MSFDVFPAATTRRSAFAKSAFTLVELLVVIGIIALLISILLPALQSARKQAAAVKCAAQLREVGNAFALYAGDNQGYFPPAQLQALAPGYNVDGRNFVFATDGVGVYWPSFVAKYVTKTKQGVASSGAEEASQAKASILWGCPEWEGYRTTAAGGFNRVQTGWGMNVWPTFTASHTPNQVTAPIPERAWIASWSQTSPGTGRFHKQNVWGRQGAQRLLIADSLFWAAESQRVPDTKVLRGQAMLLNNAAAGNWAYGLANTLVDAYRHGKYPPPSGDGVSYKAEGGKVAFNVLYVDGHVATAVDRTEAFRAVRQRFPN